MQKKNGFQILFPITYAEFDKRQYLARNIKGFLFDDLDYYIQMRSPSVKILAFTTTSENNILGRYNFIEPKFFINDKVWFKDNKGFEMEGEIKWIETHWDSNNKSYHIYSIYKFGRKRLMHVGEENIYYKYIDD